MTEFNVNFTEVRVDGESRHSHSLEGFETNLRVQVILDTQGTKFTGQSDIPTDGLLTWFGVQTAVTIIRHEVIAIIFADRDTGGHFREERIYGIVEALRS